MDYIKKTYTDKAVEVQISSFAGKGGVTEYHVLLAITDRTLPFSGQLQNIQRAYVCFFFARRYDTEIFLLV